MRRTKQIDESHKADESTRLNDPVESGPTHPPRNIYRRKVHETIYFNPGDFCHCMCIIS